MDPQALDDLAASIAQHGEIALVENFLRQDLTAVDEAEALDCLMKMERYT